MHQFIKKNKIFIRRQKDIKLRVVNNVSVITKWGGDEWGPHSPLTHIIGPVRGLCCGEYNS